MVKMWKEGKVKVNGVYFQITEDVIVVMFEILVEGFKFFRDMKVLMNEVNNFMKSSKEKNDLVKCEMYYDLDSI